MRPLVLVIEDDAAVARYVRSCLESNGYRVRAAGSASEGIAAARAEKPGLVLTDVKLPGVDGGTAAWILHRDFDDVPVVLMSGLPPGELYEKMIYSHADDAIAKPFSPRDLLKKIGRWVRGRCSCEGESRSLRS